MCAVFALASVTSTAYAQSDEEARRQAITEAWRLRNAGDHPGALNLAARAGEARMVPQLRRFIAEEQLATGALVDAWNSGVRCVREAETLTGPARAETITACERLLRRLDARVARVELRLPAEAPGLVARVNGANLASEFLRDPIGVAAGSVRIEVSAPGRVDFERVVEAPRGAMTSVPVELRPRTGAETPAEPPHTRPVAPWLLVGAGASIVTSGVLTGLFFAARATVAESACYSDAQCPSDVLDTKRRGETFGTVALITGGVGAALAATGLVLMLTAPRREAPRVTLLVGPRADGATLGVVGAF